MAKDKDDDVFEEKDWLFSFFVQLFRTLPYGCLGGFVISMGEDMQSGYSFLIAFVVNQTFVAWAATCYCLHRLIPIFLRWARHTGIYP